ncbi:MAG: hypothetical protein KGD73_06150 [Candidatus Lokiarchaeota archaeon]|nr:hypothetical protein [Candidatus Lokiarchaeota archaeon]
MEDDNNLSSLERILMILDGEKPERVASMCLGADYDFFYKFMNSPFAITEEEILKFERDRLSFTTPSNQYLIAKFSPPHILPAGLDAKIDMCWQTVIPGSMIKAKNGKGFVFANGSVEKFSIRENGIPSTWYIGPSILTELDFKTYWESEDRLSPQKAQFSFLSKSRKTMLKNYDVVVSQGINGPFENCILGIGPVNFARLARKNPTFLKKHMEFQWNVIEEPSLRLLMDTKPNLVMCGDDYGYNLGLQIPLKQWQEFVKPYLKKYVDIVHDKGVKFIIHTCGDIHELFPDFVEIGIDGVESLQPQMNDLEMYRKKYPEITLLGTIDDTELLKSGTPESVRREVKSYIAKLGKNGGYIPGPTNFLLDQPPENIVALYKAIQEK